MIRCAAALSAPPSLMMSWETSKWFFADPPGDYASDIEALGMPEFLGSIANLLGILLVWLLVRTSYSEKLHSNARCCIQWMLVYFMMHAAIHMTWGYQFRVPFTSVMNIAFAWMRHYGFSVSWLGASATRAAKGRRISEALVYLLTLLNLVIVSPRGLTIGVTSFVQPLMLWPLRFWVDSWRSTHHMRWLVGFSVLWWTFSFFIKRELQAGAACSWLNTHLTAEMFGVAGNLCLAVYIVKVTQDGIRGGSEKKGA